MASLPNEDEPSKTQHNMPDHDMPDHDMPTDHVGTHHDRLVELTRVQPIEAEVIVAHLRAAGIAATAGADSVYPSVTIADGVPVFVLADDVARASELLQGDDQPE